MFYQYLHNPVKMLVYVYGSTVLMFQEMAIIMCKIQVVRVWTMDELIELFQNIKQKIIEFKNLALIIIDSLPCLMLQFLGDENKMGKKMQKIVLWAGIKLSIKCSDI